jgi:rubrerythrin
LIRERVANVPEERALTLYRLWHCVDCGLQFSMLSRELPTLCPRCVAPFGKIVNQHLHGCPCCGFPNCGHDHVV